MKPIGFTVLMAALVVICSFATARAQTNRVIFFGDSITELAVRPDGYINQLAGLIEKAKRAGEFEVIGAGVSGNKVYDLYLREQTDVLDKRPNIVVIFVGVNDVWHKRLLGTGTDYDKFGKFYEAIVAKLTAANIKVAVCTPAVIGERNDQTNEFDGELNLYSKWIRDFAAKSKLGLVDLRQSFLEYEMKRNTDNRSSGILTTDKVHLNREGNRLVAEEIWKVLQKM